jgi:hypothetical protein
VNRIGMAVTVFVVTLGIGFPTWAQAPVVPEMPPPSDLQVEHDRAEMLQAQLQYFIDVMKRTEAEDKATKAWWTAYVAGLSPTVGPSATTMCPQGAKLDWCREQGLAIPGETK